MQPAALTFLSLLMLAGGALVGVLHPSGAAAAESRTNSLGMIFVPVPHTAVWYSIYETRVRDFAAFAATHPKLDGTNWN